MKNKLYKVLGITEKKPKEKNNEQVIEFQSQDELRNSILDAGISLASIEELRKALKEKEDELNTQDKKEDVVNENKEPDQGTTEKISFKFVGKVN